MVIKVQIFVFMLKQMTKAGKKDSLSFFSPTSFFFFFFFGGKQIFLRKLQNYDKFSFFGSNKRLGLEHFRFSKNLRGSRFMNSISAGFADKFGRKIVLQYGFCRKTKKKKNNKEKALEEKRKEERNV